MACDINQELGGVLSTGQTVVSLFVFCLALDCSFLEKKLFETKPTDVLYRNGGVYNSGDTEIYAIKTAKCK